ncbi:MAG TPA: tetratricopeptide repeat protein, partial [Polyangiaceae bacterium LLY-WYZ-15_(1-7)]|nr:tetratricopeptide repeat protein [Polyangiaceae bacterium LLY-WYZ-15_(1-7)]
ARAAFRRLAELRPRDPRPLVEIGFTHELERRYDRALELYVEARDLAPGQAYPHRVLGTRLLRWGESEPALEPLERATQLAPDHAETWKALGLARHDQGDLEGAEAAFRAGLERRPRHLGLSLSLAALLVNAGRHEEALGVYDGLVEAYPRFAAAHVGRALLLHELGRPDDAEAALIRAVHVADDPARYERRLAAYRRLRAGGARRDEDREPDARSDRPETRAGAHTEEGAEATDGEEADRGEDAPVTSEAAGRRGDDAPERAREEARGTEQVDFERADADAREADLDRRSGGDASAVDDAPATPVDDEGAAAGEPPP